MVRAKPGREVVPGHGLLFAGHVNPDAVEAQVDDWLSAEVTDPWRRRRVRRWMRDHDPVQAYWGGPDVGFVSAEHPDAEPVTILHIPDAT